MNNINDILKGLDAQKLQSMINSPRGREIAANMKGMSKEQAMSMLSSQTGLTGQQLQQLASHPSVADLLRRL